MGDPNFSILIATRNRPENMRKLLASIAESTSKPNKVVVISSGSPIEEVVSEFRHVLKIDYFHSEVAGQVNQKKTGIIRLQRETPWVMFLDDDLLLAPNAVEKAFETLNQYGTTTNEIVGIGLGLTPTTRLNRSSYFKNLIGRAFFLSSDVPGKVLRSGQGVSYLENPEPMFTEWLNGASMWRIESANQYLSSVPSSNYAACEDLVFSYRQSKKGKLLYVPYAKVFFQDSESNDYNRPQAIVSGLSWRYFFVKSNSELSTALLLYSQVGRLIYILITDHRNRKAIKATFFSLRQLIYAVTCNKESMYLIEKNS